MKQQIQESKATLVVMAAGIGSRFGGGIKQLEPVGPKGEILMDYSLMDAKAAGFTKVVFVIRKDLEADFRKVIGNRVENLLEVAYAYQEVDQIPAAFQEKFAGRTKPWGTGQAILSCKNVVTTPFLVINADDYYGKEAFVKAYQYLTDGARKEKEICMVSFVLQNTLSDNGAVTRGVCKVSQAGYLQEIVETPHIEKRAGGAVVCENGQETVLEGDLPVSMNMWGLDCDFFETLEKGFRTFLDNLPKGDLKGEYLLPTIIGELLQQHRLTVKVLTSKDQWFGVTYREDKESVVAAIRELIQKGAYK